jgi:hypothetical protein
VVVDLAEAGQPWQRAIGLDGQRSRGLVGCDSASAADRARLKIISVAAAVP